MVAADTCILAGCAAGVALVWSSQNNVMLYNAEDHYG